MQTPAKSSRITQLGQDEFQSPAFIKRARASYGSLFEDGYDIFQDDNGAKERARKRPRFGRDSISWKYTSRSPSPEPEVPTSPAREASATPMDTGTELYRSSPQNDASEAIDADHGMHSPPRRTLADPVPDLAEHQEPQSEEVLHSQADELGVRDHTGDMAAVYDSVSMDVDMHGASPRLSTTHVDESLPTEHTREAQTYMLHSRTSEGEVSIPGWGIVLTDYENGSEPSVQVNDIHPDVFTNSVTHGFDLPMQDISHVIEPVLHQGDHFPGVNDIPLDHGLQIDDIIPPTFDPQLDLHHRHVSDYPPLESDEPTSRIQDFAPGFPGLQAPVYHNEAQRTSLQDGQHQGRNTFTAYGSVRPESQDGFQSQPESSEGSTSDHPLVLDDDSDDEEDLDQRGSAIQDLHTSDREVVGQEVEIDDEVDADYSEDEDRLMGGPDEDGGDYDIRPHPADDEDDSHDEDLQVHEPEPAFDARSSDANSDLDEAYDQEMQDMAHGERAHNAYAAFDSQAEDEDASDEEDEEDRQSGSSDAEGEDIDEELYSDDEDDEEAEDDGLGVPAPAPNSRFIRPQPTSQPVVIDLLSSSEDEGESEAESVPHKVPPPKAGRPDEDTTPIEGNNEESEDEAEEDSEQEEEDYAVDGDGGSSLDEESVNHLSNQEDDEESDAESEIDQEEGLAIRSDTAARVFPALSSLQTREESTGKVDSSFDDRLNMEDNSEVAGTVSTEEMAEQEHHQLSADRDAASVELVDGTVTMANDIDRPDAGGELASMTAVDTVSAPPVSADTQPATDISTPTNEVQKQLTGDSSAVLESTTSEGRMLETSVKDDSRVASPAAVASSEQQQQQTRVDARTNSTSEEFESARYQPQLKDNITETGADALDISMGDYPETVDEELAQQLPTPADTQLAQQEIVRIEEDTTLTVAAPLPSSDELDVFVEQHVEKMATEATLLTTSNDMGIEQLPSVLGVVSTEVSTHEPATATQRPDITPSSPPAVSTTHSIVTIPQVEKFDSPNTAANREASPLSSSMDTDEELQASLLEEYTQEMDQSINSSSMDNAAMDEDTRTMAQPSSPLKAVIGRFSGPASTPPRFPKMTAESPDIDVGVNLVRVANRPQNETEPSPRAQRQLVRARHTERTPSPKPQQTRLQSSPTQPTTSPQQAKSSRIPVESSPEVEDRSVLLARAAVPREAASTASSIKDGSVHKPEDDTESMATIKLHLARHLRDELRDCYILEGLRYHLNKVVNVIAVVMMQPAEPQRTKAREYAMSFSITDHSIGPNSVMEVQFYRPHKESLPAVKPGDIVLLRRFKVLSLTNKGFGLRTQPDGSSWAVFDRESEPAQIKGPPVEYDANESVYVDYLREWHGLLDEKARARLERANKRIIDASGKKK